MAEQNAQIAKTVKYFISLAAVGKTLTEAQKSEVNDKASSKLMKECCTPDVAHVAESQTFPRVAGKVKKLPLDRYINEFLPELAITMIHNELIKKDRKAPRPEATDSRVAPILDDIRSRIAAKHEIKTKGAAVNSVTKRLTDSSGYTGSHKERFDESGKGKGIKGREDVASNSGYVSGYKHEGTYDGTKK